MSEIPYLPYTHLCQKRTNYEADAPTVMLRLNLLMKWGSNNGHMTCEAQQLFHEKITFSKQDCSSNAAKGYNTTLQRLRV